MRWPQLAKRCVPLPVGDTVTLTLHGNSTGRNAHLGLTVKVTLLDAQHCPVSVALSCLLRSFFPVTALINSVARGVALAV